MDHLAGGMRYRVGRTPLPTKTSVWGALIKGSLNQMKQALSDGAEVDELTELGTPLMHAVACGRKDLMKVLLDAGANVNAMATRGSQLDFFQDLGIDRDNFLALMEPGAMADDRQNCRTTPLSIAASKGIKRVANILLDYGADPNLPAGYAGSPLQAGALCGWIETVELLVLGGAYIDINPPDGIRMSPLYAAISQNHDSIAESLLSRGAHFDMTAIQSRNAIRMAITKENYSVLEMLLMYGPNIQDWRFTDDINDLAQLQSEFRAKRREGNKALYEFMNDYILRLEDAQLAMDNEHLIQPAKNSHEKMRLNYSDDREPDKNDSHYQKPDLDSFEEDMLFPMDEDTATLHWSSNPQVELEKV